MDNFEWASGYHDRFGLHRIDFSDPERKRVPKKSANLYKKIVAENGFPSSHGTSSKKTKSIASSITAAILLGITSHFMMFT